jgi:hypothetical protein
MEKNRKEPPPFLEVATLEAARQENKEPLFEHHWQAYRTRKDRSLPTVSDMQYKYDKKGKYIACVKVIDVFGCDTSTLVEIDF